MAEYRPSMPFNVPLWVFVPKFITSKGSTKKIYPDKGELIYCSFRTFGGTESSKNTESGKNGLLVIEDTAVIETWFRPDIKSDCKIIDADGIEYEILGKPENINKRNQFLKFKIRSVQGGV